MVLIIALFFAFVVTLSILLASGIVNDYGTSRMHESTNNYRMGDLGYLHNQWAEFFKEKDFGFINGGGGLPHSLKFKYYGGTWILYDANTLYWVHSSFRGTEKESPEYQSTWNYWRYDYQSIKYIMENHPNLRDVRKNLKTEDKRPAIIR